MPYRGPERQRTHQHRPTLAVRLLIVLALFAGCGKKKEEDPGVANPDLGPVVENREPQNEEKSLVYLRGTPVTRNGTVVRSEQTLSMPDGILTTSSAAGTSQGKAVMTDREVRKIEFVSDKEKLIDMEEKSTVMVLTAADTEPVKTDYKSPLQGQQISALKQADGTWWFGLKEGSATPEQTAELQEFGDPDVLSTALYPEKPVSMGDKWESDVTAIRGLLGEPFKPSRGTMNMKINRLRTVDGQRCAEIEVKVDCEGTYAGGPSPLVMKLEMKGQILRSLNTFQDLRTDLNGIIALEQNILGGGENKTALKIDGVIKFTRENKVTAPEADAS